MTFAEQNDRRIRRTKLAIFDAFRDLVLSQRYDAIRTSDIIEGAGVGRSTFYDHFKSKDDVLLTSIEPLFATLADISAGTAARHDVFFVLEHFWAQRAFARVIFRGDVYERLTRKLADMICERLQEDDPAQRTLSATADAHGRLGVIRAWLLGDFSMSADDLTDEFLSPKR